MTLNESAAIVAFLIGGVAVVTWYRARRRRGGVAVVDGVEISAILAEVQGALEAIGARLRGVPLPPLESVTLTLAGSTVEKAEGKVSMVIAYGYAVQRETTQELVLTLAPPRAQGMGIVAPRAALAERLVDAVVGAVEGVQTARQNKAAPLDLQALDVSVGFVVESDLTAAGSFTIQPVTVSAGADLKDKALQKLHLVFKM